MGEQRSSAEITVYNKTQLLKALAFIRGCTETSKIRIKFKNGKVITVNVVGVNIQSKKQREGAIKRVCGNIRRCKAEVLK